MVKLLQIKGFLHLQVLAIEGKEAGAEGGGRNV